MAPVYAENELVLPRQDLQQPLAAGRKRYGHRRRRAWAFGEDAYEANDVRSYGMVPERILRHEPDDLAALADHDLAIKGKPACQFLKEFCSLNGTPDHERARRTDVDGIEVFQLFGECRRSEGPVPANVNPFQKNNDCQALSPVGYGLPMMMNVAAGCR